MNLKCFTKKLNNESGFSLPELLMAVMILLPLFTGIMFSMTRGIELSDMSRNSAMALLACENRMAQIENADFDDVFANYNNVSFTSNDVTGRGVTYVDNTDPELLEIYVSFSFQQRSGRVIGEDRDLDGTIDAGEDLDGNNRLDSIIQLSTIRYNY